MRFRRLFLSIGIGLGLVITLTTLLGRGPTYFAQAAEFLSRAVTSTFGKSQTEEYGIAEVHVLAPTGPVTVGSVFNVIIKAKQVSTPVSAFQFELMFDPGVIKFRHAIQEDFLGSTGRQVTCPGQKANGGSIKMACASTGSATGPTGDGDLVTLTFEALGVGTSELILGEFQLADVGRPPDLIPADLYNGQVTIELLTWRIYLPSIVKE